MTSPHKHSFQPMTRTALALAVSAALTSQAFAQEIEEVLVTATKRASDIQDIPISVTALSGDLIEELQLVNVLDLDKTVPGMKVRYVGADPTIIMRGAGTAGTNDIAVPIYVDGLYRPRAGQALASYLDLDRVEILRGPQGTLFGRNTFGGLVNIIAKKPDTQELDFGIKGTYGDYDLRKFEGFGNVPLGEKAALRVSFSDTKSDPLIENVFNPSGGMRDEDNTYVRAQLRFEPTDNFDVTFTATDWEDTSNGNADFAGVILGIPINPVTGLTDGINGVLQPRQGRIPGTENDGWPGSGGRNQAGIFGSDPSASVIDDEYKISSDFQPLRRIEETSFSALVNWDFGPAALRANLGVFDYEEFRLTDSDFSPNPTNFTTANPDAPLTGSTGPGYWQQCWGGGSCGLAAGQRTVSEAVQADINLNSNSDGPLQWTLGYFLYDDSDPGDTSGEFVWGYTDTAAPQQVSWGHWLYQGNGGTKSTAIYGQAEYSFGERTRVTAGLRRSKDERQFFNRYVDWGPAVHGWASGYYSAHESNPGSRFASWPVFVDSTTDATANSRQSGEDEHTDWRLGIQRDISANMMAYASASTGYIAGGIAGGGSTDLTDPNEVDAYEIGLKATLLDGTMRLNVAGFYNDYEGLTTSSFVAQGATIVAVGSVGGSMTSKGIEAEMNWAPNDRLKINAGLALNDSELDKFGRSVLNRVFRSGGDFEIGTDTDNPQNNSQVYVLDGKEARFSPDWTLSVDATYDFDLADLGRVVPGVYLYHSDNYKTTNIEYFFAKQDAYTTVDLRATWYAADSPFTVQAFVKNATDEVVQVGSDQFSQGRAVADFNNPRVWGLTVGYNF